MLYTVTDGNVKVGGQWLKPGDQFESKRKSISGPLLKLGLIKPGQVEVTPEPKVPFVVANETPKPSDTSAIMCPDCDKVFPSEAALDEHRAKKHKAQVAKEKKIEVEGMVDGQAPPE